MIIWSMPRTFDWTKEGTLEVNFRVLNLKAGKIGLVF